MANRNTIICGSTNSGKTCCMLQIIKEGLVEPMPQKIIYMFNVKQRFMSLWNRNKDNPHIDFVEGLDFSKVTPKSILVIDDLLLDINKDVASSFILGSHHKEISLFFITQNLFPRDPLFRLMSLNCHYFILFQNPRNYRQVETLARQAFVNDVDRVIQAYKSASQQTRGFIVLTFNPLIPNELRVITDYFDRNFSVYLKNAKSDSKEGSKNTNKKVSDKEPKTTKKTRCKKENC